MTRWKHILLALAVLSLCSPLAAHPASLGLYDDFSKDTIDAAK